MAELDKLATDLFERYHSGLLQSLHMNDPNFIQTLYKHKLLDHDIEDELHSMTKTLDKASFFLDHAIRPGLNYEKFQKLISAMKKSSHDNVVDLAYEVQLQFIFLQNSDARKVQSTYISIYVYMIFIILYIYVW